MTVGVDGRQIGLEAGEAGLQRVELLAHVVKHAVLRLAGRIAAGAFQPHEIRDLRRAPFFQIAAERAVDDADMAAVDPGVIGAERPRKGHRVQARDQVAGRHDRIDRFLALRQVAGIAGQFDREGERGRMHGHGDQVARLAVDEVVGAQAFLEQRLRADAALQFADDEGQDDVALQLHARFLQRLDGTEIGRIAKPSCSRRRCRR